ncbi:hypothetical protein [Halobacillus naozhouensis]|uniref:Uncharacterized protein n=1 Tax=Halobacillus naozhouensis TaxID=554880 RepID=A0ABY8IX44_9BACI|nr:hypothetical protein [Halobacillus naozhouensis]WFT74803.1 hypothetical protein P9989_21115 [Halobacillus naozhouensis]
MIDRGKIKLTVNELVSALVLCGYEQVASQILNDHKLIQNEAEFDRFVYQAEISLRGKGYWDDDKETNIASGLEDLLHLLIQSTKKLRCVNMENERVLLIHDVNQEHSLIQEIHNHEHTFWVHQNADGFESIFISHYGLEKVDYDRADLQTIQLSDTMLDELHTTEADVLGRMIRDEKVDSSLRSFLQEFLRNGQELDNIAFMVSNYVEDQSKFDQIVFLLPGQGLIWHVDYENVNNHEIFIHPVEIGEYFHKIEHTLLEFFHNSIKAE